MDKLPLEMSNSIETLPSAITEEPVKSPISSQESPSLVLIVTAGYDHTIRFWDVLEATCLATLQHNESVKIIIIWYINLNPPPHL